MMDQTQTATEFRNPRKFAFVILCLIVGLLLVFLIFRPGFASAGQSAGYVQDVRRIDTLDLEIEHPEGLIYRPEAGLFYLLQDGNLTGFDLQTNPAGVIWTGLPENEVAHITYAANPGRLIALDQSVSRLTFVDLRGDNPVIQVIPVRTGVRDAAGIAFDPDSGSLFVLDRSGPAIVRLAPQVAGELLGAGPVFEAGTRIPLPGLSGRTVDGLAFDPGSGSLYVFSREDSLLHAVSENGAVQQSWSLDLSGLVRIGGMAVAPNADSTDDPEKTGLYILNLETSQVVELDLSQSSGPLLPSVLLTPVLVSTIDTSNANWNPSSPDPVGIDYHPALANMIISDSEIEEDLGNPPPPYYQGFNIFLSTTAGVQAGNCDTTAFSNEPVGVAVNPDNGHIFYADDNANEIFEIDFGPDGQYCTADDVLTSFDTLAFGSDDPEGVAYGNGLIAIADGVDREVYIIDPGANAVFDGIPPAGDDSVTNFDVFSLGFNDPEGIDYSEDTGNWFVVNRNNDYMAEITSAGSLVQNWDIAFLSAVSPAGISAAPASTLPGETTLYISQRGIDNNTDPNENDGIVFEVSIGMITQHPQAIDDLGIAKSGQDAVLTWGAVLTNTNNISVTTRYYHIYRDTDPDVDLTTPLTTQADTIFTDTGVLDDGVAYYYAVLAEDTRGLVSGRSNRVGVFPVTVYQGWNQLSWPILPPDTTLDAVLGDQFFGTADPQTADRVLVWDEATQTYESAWFCGGPICEGWGEPFANHWLANDFSQSTLTLNPDSGFWFQNRSGADEFLALVGRVFEADRPIDILVGWNMLGSSFLDTRLLDTAGVPATGTDSPTTADRILYWDPTLQSYQTAWYCGGPVCEGWGPSFADHWLANDFSISTIVLEPGHGFWFQNRHTPLTWVVSP